jgi:hypothetical protein
MGMFQNLAKTDWKRHFMVTVRSGLMCCVAGLAAMLIGCGKPPMLSVSGTVKLDGKLVENCKVGFFPDTTEFNPDRHGFGFGVTNKDGKFEIQHPQGEKGIYPGKYKVIFILWADKAGKIMPTDIKPSEVEGGVVNLFPTKYEEPSTTPESVTVANQANVFDFDVKSK